MFIVLKVAPCINSKYNSLTVFVLVVLRKGVPHKPEIREPEKCAEWKWIDNGKQAKLENMFPSLSYYLELNIDPMTH